MKIQCVLERKGGSKVELGGLEYHFEELEDGAHVADVEKEEHIDRFLSISEAFKVYHGKGTPKGSPVQVGELTAVPAPRTNKAREGSRLSGSPMHASSYDVNGKTYSQMDIVQIAFAASNMTEDEWNNLPDEDRAARMDITLDDLADEAEAAGDEADAEPATQEPEVKAAKGGRKGKKAA